MVSNNHMQIYSIEFDGMFYCFHSEIMNEFRIALHLQNGMKMNHHQKNVSQLSYIYIYVNGHDFGTHLI